ncbi:MAG: hypothetical protein HZB62_13415 [Nitrospirae bacterium]|nr:hypothetical protein [Nitrospirota bacterium]
MKSKKTIKFDAGYEMFFETTIRVFLGDKAYHIAGQVHTDKYRLDWYKKALKKIVKRLHELETTTKHKEQLTYWAERALKASNTKDFDETSFSLCLFRLVGALLGFVTVRGMILYNPIYHQERSQHNAERMLQTGDPLQPYLDGKSTIGIRKKIIQQLKSEGLTDYDISLVLNTTEYEIKKLRMEL